MKQKRIEELFRHYDFHHRQGFKRTLLDEVQLLRVDHHKQTKALLYNRGIILIASGQKTGYIDDEPVTVGSDNYVIIATVQPIECETFVFDQVIQGVYINLNLQRLQRIASLLDQHSPVPTAQTPSNLVRGTMNGPLDSAFRRLITILRNPQDAKILGDAILDEIYYRIIESPEGQHLVQLCCHNTHFSRISNIVDELQNRLDESVTIDDLAQKAEMSKASFHKKFKEIFNDSPIQYLKKIRPD